MRELHSHVHDGAVAGSVSFPSLLSWGQGSRPLTGPPLQVIRNITNRYGEAYAEANSDIKASRRTSFASSLVADPSSRPITQRLDDALSRPLDPHVTSAPREASVWTGTLVIPTLQADVLQAWLSSNPAAPQQAQQGQEGQQSKKIDPEREFVLLWETRS